MLHEFWTPAGVRLRRTDQRPGSLNWLFLPGGPGIGSESLEWLVNAVQVPGTSWLVDLPGDGSNTSSPSVGEAPFHRWPAVLIEAAQALPDVVFVGHSTGGMYLLSVPELAPFLVGLALISYAPHCGWMTQFADMTLRHPLPAVESATAAYEAEPSNDNLRRIAVASAPWNFTPAGVSQGTALLGRMPYNAEAVNWSARNFDDTYEMRWWPTSTPTLVVSGAHDRIVTQALWDQPRFHDSHVLHHRIEAAAHFPWVEQPDAVRSAFYDLTTSIEASSRRQL